MKIYIFISFLITSTLLATEYKYSYHKNGLPTVRVEKTSGTVEIYSNLHKMKFTDTMLHNIHQENYKDWTCENYIQKVKKRFLNLEFKVQEQYRWVEHNKYLKIKELEKFSTDI